MTRPYLRGQERRRQILVAAERLVAERGFDAMTMPDLAAAAGVSVGGLYRHFPSKRDVVLGLVEADASRMVTSEEPASLTEFVADEISALGGQEALAVRAEIIATSARDKAVAVAATKHDDITSEAVRRLVAGAASAGSLGALDAAAVVELVGVLIDGIATRSAVVGHVDPGYVELVDVVLRLVLDVDLQVLEVRP